MSAGKLVSIVIPAYNSSETLLKTLPSILAQDQTLIEEIIVVDSSDDGAMNPLIDRFEPKGIRFINAGTRIMPAIQRNIGARASTGELMVFLDSDVILAPDYITKVVGYFRSGKVAGFGAIDLPDFQANQTLPIAQYYLQLNEYLPSGKSRVMPFFSGCNNYCSRSIFESIGGYPEIRASEDVLYGMNIRNETEIWFFPDTCVLHIFRNEWSGFKRNQEMLGKYVAKYRKKNSRGFVLRGILPILLYPAFLGIKLIRIFPRIAAAGPKHIFRFISVFPVFFAGLCYWTNGFVAEMTSKEEQI